LLKSKSYNIIAALIRVNIDAGQVDIDAGRVDIDAGRVDVDIDAG